MIKKLLGCLVVLWMTAFHLKAQTAKAVWVDSVLSQMSIEEKIAQLLMVMPSDDADASDLADFAEKIKDHNPGAVVFKKIHPDKAPFIDRIQRVAKTPLLVALHGQSQLGLELDTALRFPHPAALGAIADDSLIYALGAEVARQMKLMGIHLNFIRANLSAGNRADNAVFGETPYRVASKTLAYWKGLQTGGLLACANYFTVQGVSIIDVEKGLPVVEFTVDSTRAYPFKVLSQQELPALMAGPADLPLFYTAKKTAVKNIFSSRILTAAFTGEWTKKNLGYDGLLIADIPAMVKSSNKLKGGDAEVLAFKAGNDMLMTAGNVGPVVRKMKRLLRKQKEFVPLLDDRVKKILALKYDAGISRKQNINTENLVPNLITTEAQILQRRLNEAIPTVLANRHNTLPIRSLENKKFTCVIADDSVKGRRFTSVITKYILPSVLNITEKTDTVALADTLARQQVVIVALFPETKTETLARILPVLKRAQANRQIIVCDFGSPFFASHAHNFETIITGYSDDREMLRVVPQIVFGGLPATGILPVTFGALKPGTIFKTPVLNRLAYSFPEDAGMDAKTLEKIDAIAKEAIDMRATPGCQVLVARDGKVVYQKSFGHLTYENQTPVTNQTLYDLASITKVSATLQAVMFMHEKGLIDINKKASVYLPELKGSNKENFTLKDILTHQAGLWPFLPFWTQTMKDSLPLPEYYSRVLSRQHPLVVADNLYASAAMKDSLWHWIIKAKIREKPMRTPFDYRYSDMGFYILQHLAEKILNQPMEDFLLQNFYEPLGAYTMGYLPLLRFPIRQIAPTEHDRLFRRALLIGTVHDQGAAMLGGIAGHAGLFSNANDLAKLGQMLLQQGNYGGLRYYHPETIKLFTQKQFENSRRGLGWDKPVTGDWNSPTAMQASPETFGHTGFTGTSLWVDPEFNLVYIFLSNRVHPDMTNNKLLSANIRSRIQEVVYQSIFNYCKTGGSVPEIPVNLSVQAFSGSQ